MGGFPLRVEPAVVHAQGSSCAAGNPCDQRAFRTTPGATIKQLIVLFSGVVLMTRPDSVRSIEYYRYDKHYR